MYDSAADNQYNAYEKDIAVVHFFFEVLRDILDFCWIL